MPDPATALTLWKARDLVHDYLAASDEAARGEILLKLQVENRIQAAVRAVSDSMI